MFSIVKKGYLKILLNIEGQTLYNGIRRAQTPKCFLSRTQSEFWPLSYLTLIVMVAGVGAKRLPTASNFQRLCLRNLWMAIPRESRRSHVPVTAKALLITVDKERNLIKRSFFHHCGTIIYCACVVETIKNLSEISIMAKAIEKL